jgi:uncharacterized membrane protein
MSNNEKLLARIHKIAERQGKLVQSFPKLETQKTVDLSKDQEWENAKKEQDLKHKDDKHDLATSTYKKLFYAICIYIILILLMLIGNSHYFKLSDSVLIALLTTTTANIVGIFAIASKWVYETNR